MKEIDRLIEICEIASAQKVDLENLLRDKVIKKAEKILY